MKALLLSLVLGAPFLPLMGQEEASLSMMPPAATGIAHGYALWTTGQIQNPYGCVFGSAHPEEGVIVYAAGMVRNPDDCQAQENAIGMVVFVHDEIDQEKVCGAARVIRADYPKLVLMGTVHGLEIGTLLSGDVYTRPQVTWCATPIEHEQFYRPPSADEPEQIA